MATGWKEFQQSNDISQGDKCVFKFITSEDKICLAKITKRKTPLRPLPPATEAPVTEVDEDGDEDEDVELVDEEGPFFVTTITRSHNKRLVRF